MKNIYLERYAWPEKILDTYQDFDTTGIIVVIPAYNEPELARAVGSLDACYPPEQDVLVIVVVNEPEHASEAVQAANRRACSEISGLHTWFRVKTVHLKLPDKKAGVGLARKIGMDEAVRVFQTHNRQGIIVCYDADCTCDKNYFLAIEDFYQHQENNLGLVYYEHPLNGNHPSEIIQYEVFLRYYIDALRFAGYPNAVQTLGSCITVRSAAYEKQGGMNTRKAGEDFYFIHKMVPLGGIGEIKNTCVYPSDRTSDRVPFGTGHAINKYLQQPTANNETYNPATFQDLERHFSSYQYIYNQQRLPNLLPESVRAFYQQHAFERDLKKILKQSNNPQNFRKGFFAWWDGFKVLKFVHFCRDHVHPNIPLTAATDWLIRTHFQSAIRHNSMKDRLLMLRAKDRQADFYIK